MTNVTPLITGVIAVLGAILTYVVAPFIKSLRSKIEDERIQKAVDAGCKWAEQTLKDVSGSEKRRRVLEYMKTWLEARGYTYDVDQLDIFLEASVFELNNPQQVITFSETVELQDDRK